MTSFPIHTPETAPADARPILEDAQKGLGFIPNLYATMAESPRLLDGYKTLAAIFGNTNLSDTEQQVIMMTNNVLNGCVYCMAAHTTLSQMQGVAEDDITALRDGTPFADPKLNALRVFTTVIFETRGWPKDADIATFLAAGYTKQTVLEVILGTSLKVMSNYTNHIAETPVDAAFTKNVWTPKAT